MNEAAKGARDGASMSSVTVRIRSAGAAAWLALVCCFLAQGCLTPTPRPEVEARVAAVSEARLRADVEALAALGPRPQLDAQATEAALQHLESELRALGLAPRREPFEASYFQHAREETPDGVKEYLLQRLGPAANLLVELRGQGRPERVLELGAHYDTVPNSPGADDNASGCAALLEVARVLADAPLEHTLRLCFYALEEEGYDGSLYHAAQVAASDETHLGAIVVDMIGYASHEPRSQRSPARVPMVFYPPFTADFVIVAGNFPSGGLGNDFEGYADAYVPALEYYSVNRLAGLVEDGRRSDHASYWNAGLRAILLSDTAELRTPHYHQPSDTPETLDYEFLTNVTRALVATTAELTGLAEP